MYKVEYLFGGRWNVAIEVPSLMIAQSEFTRLSRAYLTRMSGSTIVGYRGPARLLYSAGEPIMRCGARLVLITPREYLEVKK